MLGLDRPPTGLGSAPSVPSASVAGGLVNRAGSGSMSTVPVATVPSVASQTSRGGAHNLQNYVPYLADFTKRGLVAETLREFLHETHPCQGANVNVVNHCPLFQDVCQGPLCNH